MYHRELITRIKEIEELEKKWNCKIEFPSTETASDVVTISGPEYQVPKCVDEFLRMVPEKHYLLLPVSAQLKEFFKTDEFEHEVRQTLKQQYEVVLRLRDDSETLTRPETTEEQLSMAYTRNNAGGLKDAIDYLLSRLIAHGLDATAVKGTIPRPKSDSFEDSLPFFESKLFKIPGLPHGTDSPTRSTFGDDSSDRGSILGKIRKPGSIASFTSFLDRRKNQSNSPGQFFKHASSNASRASLVSLESQHSGFRHPWNDSGVNLPEEEYHNGWPVRFDPTQNGAGKSPYGMVPGDMTPKHDPRASFDSGRPSTSHSTSGFPGPIGPPR